MPVLAVLGVQLHVQLLLQLRDDRLGLLLLLLLELDLAPAQVRRHRAQLVRVAGGEGRRGWLSQLDPPSLPPRGTRNRRAPRALERVDRRVGSRGRVGRRGGGGHRAWSSGRLVLVHFHRAGGVRLGGVQPLAKRRGLL